MLLWTIFLIVLFKKIFRDGDAVEFLWSWGFYILFFDILVSLIVKYTHTHKYSKTSLCCEAFMCNNCEQKFDSGSTYFSSYMNGTHKHSSSYLCNSCCNKLVRCKRIRNGVQCNDQMIIGSHSIILYNIDCKHVLEGDICSECVNTMTSQSGEWRNDRNFNVCVKCKKNENVRFEEYVVKQETMITGKNHYVNMITNSFFMCNNCMLKMKEAIGPIGSGKNCLGD